MAKAADALERLSRLLSKRRRRGKKAGSQPAAEGQGDEAPGTGGADEGEETAGEPD